MLAAEPIVSWDGLGRHAAVRLLKPRLIDHFSA